MSLRNVRKLYGTTTLPPPNESSDEEYEPLYAKNSGKSMYANLALSSSNDSEHESPETAAETSKCEEIKKNKKKKKKKQQKVKKSPKNSISNNDLDEIDISLMEINEKFGEPSPGIPSTPEVQPDLLHTLFSVKYKHLNVSNELLRLFGPETPDETPRRRGRQPNLKKIHKYCIIPKEYNFKKMGLSMSMNRRDDGIAYFTFDHSREYQRIHKEFMMMIAQSVAYMHTSVEVPMKTMHVEGLLEVAEVMFRMEDYSNANSLLEHIVAYMQFVSHPSFNVTDMRVRLEYKILENRPFHIAVLKYLHILTNKACHRTALELAKLLLNLDPSDPLAIVLIIDTLALRAREHQWLIDAVDYLDKEREVGFMFNIQFSYAMAHFHVATKKKQDLKRADELIQRALLGFPYVLPQILLCAPHTPSPKIQSLTLYSTAETATTRNLRDLILMYATLTGPRWREPPVIEWLLRNAEEIGDKYENDPAVKEEAKRLEKVRGDLFRGWPEEVYRHLSIIKSMSQLLVDGAVPRTGNTRSFDPAPPRETVNRYGYSSPVHPVPLGNFFTSMLPNFDLPPHNEDDPVDPFNAPDLAPHVGHDIFGLETDEEFDEPGHDGNFDSEDELSDNFELVLDENNEFIPGLMDAIRIFIHMYNINQHDSAADQDFDPTQN